MKRTQWQLILAASLIALSVLIYGIHFLLFHDAHHILIYLVGDIAFVPIEVLLVTLVLERILHYRAKRAKMQKLNMVIGAFFSEVGSHLLRSFSRNDPESDDLAESLKLTLNSQEADFTRIRDFLKSYKYPIGIKGVQLAELKAFLLSKRPFLLRLLGNPNLLEHDAFTDCLWAVFHLTEELSERKEILDLGDRDYHHICGDLSRAYRTVSTQWLDYMQHLKKSYPYLFSLALRTHPFDPAAKAEVTE